MKRVLLTAPASFTAADLTPVQAEAIRGILGQWVMPMPGTVTTGGLKVIDALTTDAFNPVNIDVLGLPFGLIGMWQWPGAGEMEVLVPLDEGAFEAFLPPAAELHEPHRWAGWPAAF